MSYYSNRPQHKKDIILKKQKEFYKLYPWKRVWIEINRRCYNQNCKDYKHWGGRGIKNRFSDDSEIEYLWFRDKAYLMKKPSIDRKNNDGHYCINNCHFIELKENSGKDKKVSILQFDKQGCFIKQWKSIIEATNTLKISKSSIWEVLSRKGNRHTLGGFIWRYFDDLSLI